MATREVRDKNNMPIGKCQDFGSSINALHYRYGVVGWYNKSADTTFDKSGKIYCRGDATETLIRLADSDR